MAILTFLPKLEFAPMTHCDSALERMRPLFFHQDEIYFSKGCEVVILGKDGAIRSLFSFPDKWWNRYFDRSRLIYRLRRSGIWSSITHAGDAYFSYRSELYRFNLESTHLSSEMKFERGNGPLQFCSVKSIQGFEDCLVFGEYFGNSNKNTIRIFRKTKDDIWKVTYSFPPGSLNHIHNIIADPIRNCLWVLGGDFDVAASIWQIRDNFSSVELIVSGSQQYRACVAFPVEQGLLYSTDTQLENNSIRMLERGAYGWESNEIAKLNGPCIYGCATKDFFVFSTSTEPNKNYSNNYLALLDIRPGPGIKENRSFIVTCAKSNLDCQTLTSKQKDFWPYRLFQFGSITFPNGTNLTNTLYAFNVGSKQGDLTTEIWQL